MTDTPPIKHPARGRAIQRAASKPSKRRRTPLDEMSRDLFDDMERGGPRDLATNPKHMEDFGR